MNSDIWNVINKNFELNFQFKNNNVLTFKEKTQSYLYYLQTDFESFCLQMNYDLDIIINYKMELEKYINKFQQDIENNLETIDENDFARIQSLIHHRNYLEIKILRLSLIKIF